jgi:hypothetical protein
MTQELRKNILLKGGENEQVHSIWTTLFVIVETMNNDTLSGGLYDTTIDSGNDGGNSMHCPIISDRSLGCG